MEHSKEQLKLRLTTLWNEILHYRYEIQKLEKELSRLQYCYDSEDVEAIETIILDKLDELELYIFNNEQEIRHILTSNYKLY